MKKTLLLFALLLSVFLVACQAKPGEPLPVTIENEIYLYDTISADVKMTETDLSDSALKEIANSVASQLYNKYAADMRETKGTLIVSLYSNDLLVGTMTYSINVSFDNPGLAKGTLVKP